MKSRIVLCLVILACSHINSFAQLEDTKQDQLVFKLPAYIEYKLHKIKLPNGVQLQYAEQGDAGGIPVIFLHGITDSWHSFESVLPYLPSNIHAFALSQRGHGDSDRPLSGYRPKDFADDVAAFIRMQHLKSVFIVGHSMGGVIAQKFVLDYPQLVNGVVIIGSDASFKDNPGIPEFYQEVVKLEGAINKEFMHEFQKSTLAKPIDPVYYDTLVAEGLKVPARVFKAAFQGLMEVDYLDELKKIDKPVLIFWGDKDSFCFRTDQEMLVKKIRNSQLMIYQGTGHALHWEEPQKFTDDLVSFINKKIIVD
ncbi:MAG TPA: alpha/beta hydrolase [Chitinophagaceae bacterium]